MKTNFEAWYDGKDKEAFQAWFEKVNDLDPRLQRHMVGYAWHRRMEPARAVETTRSLYKGVLTKIDRYGSAAPDCRSPRRYVKAKRRGMSDWGVKSTVLSAIVKSCD